MIFAVIMLLPLLSFIPATGAVSPLSVKTIVGKQLRASDTGGWIKVPTITASALPTQSAVWHDTSFFYFRNLGAYFPVLGFSTSSGANITNLSVTMDTVTIQVSSPLVATTSIYSPDRLCPKSATGTTGGTWNATAKAYTFTTFGASTVVLTWSSATGGVISSNIGQSFSFAYILPFIMVMCGLIGSIMGELDSRAMMMIAIYATVFTLMILILGNVTLQMPNLT